MFLVKITETRRQLDTAQMTSVYWAATSNWSQSNCLWYKKEKENIP